MCVVDTVVFPFRVYVCEGVFGPVGLSHDRWQHSEHMHSKCSFYFLCGSEKNLSNYAYNFPTTGSRRGWRDGSAVKPLAAPLEDLDSAPSTHIVAHKCL